MALLSANSRRNSAAISLNGKTVKISSEIQRPGMQLLDEVETFTDIVPSAPVVLHKVVVSELLDEIDHVSQGDQHQTNDIQIDEGILNEKKDKTCAERSDSGFSDRSTSSNSFTSNIITSQNRTNDAPTAACNDIIIEGNERISAEQIQHDLDGSKEAGAKVSVNMLKIKLEKLAEALRETKPSTNTQAKSIRKLSSSYIFDSKQHDLDDRDMDSVHTSSIVIDTKSTPLDNQINGVENENHLIIRSAGGLNQKRIVDKEPIMRSDFTNTVKMRKKSLECNALREKILHSPRIILEQSGKVSKLLQRFGSRSNSITSTSSDNQISKLSIGTPQAESDTEQFNFDERYDGVVSDQDDEVFETLKRSSVGLSTTVQPEFHESTTKQCETSAGTHIKHEIYNIKSNALSMNVKANSPTKPTNIPITINNRQTNQSKSVSSFKKSQKSTTAEAAAQSNATTSTYRLGKSNQQAKATAYASFNRTSPIRLSGRVKEVTVII